MRLADTEQQHLFRNRARAWLREHIPPGTSSDWSLEDLRTWSNELHAAGFAGLTWPVAHGGQGLPPTFHAIYAEESASAGAPDHVSTIGLNMIGPTIIRYGTRQQQRLLPRILSGEAIVCQGFSEPEAGSDLAALRLRAQPVPGGYRLDGEKVWSSYAHLADHCLLLARTGDGESRHDGLTCLLVDMHAAGIEVRPLRKLSGDADFNQLVFNGAVVASDTVVGAVGDGWSVALTTLAHERGTFGITLTSRLAAELNRLRRTVHDVGADRNPFVRREFAALHVELQALRYTGYRALAALERSGVPGPESSILKLRWSRANQRLTELGARVCAAAGDPHPTWTRYWRDQRLRSRTNTIEGGTTEILRSIIAERVLDLPRSR